MFEHYKELVRGTTIDSTTLLSTDYFNLFNEVIMLLGMLPDMPDMLEDVEAWRFKTYQEHFSESGLAFAPLAIEAYAHAPPSILERFEINTDIMRSKVEDTRVELRDLFNQGSLEAFGDKAVIASMELQLLVDAGSSIVHGQGAVLDQGAIDDLF